MNIIFTGLDFTGTPDTADIAGVRLAIDEENQRIAQENKTLESPKALWPSGNGTELKASYLAIILERVNIAHEKFINRAAEKEAIDLGLAERWRRSTPEQQQAAINELAV